MPGVGSGGEGREFGGLRKGSSWGSWRQQGNLVSICFMCLLSHFNHFYSFIIYRLFYSTVLFNSNDAMVEYTAWAAEG